MDITWIKDRLIAFAIERLRDIMVHGVKEAISVIEDDRIEEYLSKIQNPPIRRVMGLLIEILIEALKEFRTKQTLTVNASVLNAPKE